MKFACQEESHNFKGCRIISSNNFPTGAGLASSAAGYACLGVYFISVFIPMKSAIKNKNNE